MTGPGIGSYRYEHWTLAQKYAWMHQGDGPAAALDARFALDKLADIVGASDEVVRGQIAGLHLDWRGSAATAAADALACYADEVLATSAAGAVGAGTVDAYGSSFASLKNQIAQPAPEGENSIWGRALDASTEPAQQWFAVFGVQSDYHRRLMQNKAADAIANDVLYRHQTAAQQALSGFPLPNTQPTDDPGDSGNGGAGARAAGSGAGAGAGDGQAPAGRVLP